MRPYAIFVRSLSALLHHSSVYFLYFNKVMVRNVLVGKVISLLMFLLLKRKT